MRHPRTVLWEQHVTRVSTAGAAIDLESTLTSMCYLVDTIGGQPGVEALESCELRQSITHCGRHGMNRTAPFERLERRELTQDLHTAFDELIGTLDELVLSIAIGSAALESRRAPVVTCVLVGIASFNQRRLSWIVDLHARSMNKVVYRSRSFVA